MHAQGFNRAPGPAISLAAQNGVGIRGLGPAQRVRDKSNLVGNVLFFHVASHPHDQFHVFANRVHIIPATFYDDLFIKSAKSAGYQQQSIQPAPGHAAQ